MASIEEVYNVIHRISSGIGESVLECMGENADVVAGMVREQLYSGLDGNGDYLRPTYDDDPYFNEKGPWQGRGEAYKRWKARITPPEPSQRLHLPARPEEVPNLFITGPFHRSIRAEVQGDHMTVFTSGFRDGPLIERKYGEAIFSLGARAREYFVGDLLKPHLERFMRNCGY